MKKLILLATLISLLLMSLAGCGASMDGDEYYGGNAQNMVPDAEDPMEGGLPAQDADTPTFAENPFFATQEEAVSTFSADVDTASYTYFRKLVNSNYSFREMVEKGSSSVPRNFSTISNIGPTPRRAASCSV